MASCGVPTDPPATGAPTSSWPPSMSPSYSSKPTTKSPSQSPAIVVVDTTSPTFGNADDEEFGPDDPGASFFCGNDWTQAITECPHRCPSGESSQCPGTMTCYAFTPCLGIGVNTPPTAKPTWEPTMKPIPKPTIVPTTVEQYWNGKSTNTPTRKPVWWTPEPASKPTYAPTGNQCRGLPCDYEGECRSKLGFCGEGIVYCNSASSWVPSCGGGGGLIQLEEIKTNSPNTVPTASPLSQWEAWVANRDENLDDNAEADEEGSDAATDDSEKEEDEDTGFDIDAWSSWSSEGRADDSNKFWWSVGRSDSLPRFVISMPVKVVCFTVLTLVLL